MCLVVKLRRVSETIPFFYAHLSHGLLVQVDFAWLKPNNIVEDLLHIVVKTLKQNFNKLNLVV